MSVGRSLSLGALVLTVGRVATIGLSLLAIAVMTRAASVADFGQFRTAMAFLSNAMSIGTLGVNAILVREISRPDAPQSAILGAAVVLRLIVTSTALVLATLLALVLPLDAPTRIAVAVGAVGFVAYAIHTMLIGLFQQKLDQRGSVLAEVTGGVAFLLLVLLLALLQLANAVTLIAMQAIAYLITITITWRAAQRLQRFHLRVDTERWRAFLIAGAPIAITGIMQVIYYRSDTIFLALWKGPESVGIYGVPARITDGVVGLIYVFIGMVTPLLARHARGSMPEYRDTLDNALRALAVGTVGAIVILWSFAPEFVRVVGGAAYLDGVPALRILALLVFVSPLGMMMRDASTAVDAQHRLIMGYVVALVVALAAYALAIPAYGAAGAAMAVVVGEATGCAWAASIAIRSSGWSPRLRGPLVAILLGICTIVLLGWMAENGYGLVLRFLAGMAVYGGGLFVTGTIHRADVLALAGRSAKPKSGSAPRPIP